MTPSSTTSLLCSSSTLLVCPPPAPHLLLMPFPPHSCRHLHTVHHPQAVLHSPTLAQYSQNSLRCSSPLSHEPWTWCVPIPHINPVHLPLIPPQILWDITCNCICDTGVPMKVILVILILYCIFHTGATAWARASQLSLMALAWPEDSESWSCGKPGQSHSLQAKPGQNITTWNCTHIYRFFKLIYCYVP